MAPRKKKRKTTYKRKPVARRKRGALKKHSLTLDVEAHVMREIWAVLYMTLGVLTVLSLRGNLGILGDLWMAFLKPVFGWGVYAVPVLLITVALLEFFSKKITFGLARWLGITLLTTALLGTVHLSVPAADVYDVAKEGMYGGYIGFVGSFIFRSIIGLAGSYVVFLAMVVVSFLLIFDVSLREVAMLFDFSQKSKVESRDKSKVKSEEVEEDFDFDVNEINIVKPEQIQVEEKEAVR